MNKKDSVNILLSNSSSDSADFEKNDSLLKSIQQSLNELTSLNFVYPNEIMTEEFNIVKGNDTIIIKNNGTAHTDGDLSVFFKNKNVMVLGDMLFTNMYPYIDYMSNLQNWANELRNYSKLNIPYYIPGHGAVSKSTDLIVLADYLDNIKSKIVLLKSEGKTLEDAKKLSFPEINNLSPMDFRIQNIEAVWNQ